MPSHTKGAPLSEQQQILFTHYQKEAKAKGMVLERFETARSKRMGQNRIYGFACYPKCDAHHVETLLEAQAKGYWFQSFKSAVEFMKGYETC